ncbi:MAG: YidC/Oxa1 family insertase periplasmic-domain containing protein [Phycisphaerae bacterium]
MPFAFCLHVSSFCFGAPAEAPATSTKAASAPAPPASAPTVPASAPAQWVVPGAEEPPRQYIIGSLDSQKNAQGKPQGYVLQAVLDSRGSAIYTVKLADYYMTAHDKRMAARMSEAQFEQEVQKENVSPSWNCGHYSLLNPVQYGNWSYLPMETMRVWVGGVKEPFYPDTSWQCVRQETAPDGNSESITFAWTLGKGTPGAPLPREAEVLRLEKTYTVHKLDYSITVTLKVENRSAAEQVFKIDQAGPTGVPEEPHVRGDSRQAVYGRLDPGDKTVSFNYKAEKDLKDVKEYPSEDGLSANERPVGTSNEAKPIVWIGQTNKYFAALLHPELPAGRHFEGASFYLSAAEESPYSRTWLTGMTLSDIKLKPGQSEEIGFDLFTGPKDRDMLKGDPAALGKPLYKELNYFSTVDVTGSGCCGMTFCTFGWLTVMMMWLLTFFAKYGAFGNYGVAIMILVVLVRLVLHPLTKKGQVSMARMQKLAPLVNKLKEKYADDKETLNKEMMKLYKQQGPAQIMGCLPMFLQMPIWIALWTALNNAIELRQAPFLPVWITDLSSPDSIISWSKPVELPLFGAIYGFNLLPILMVIAMVLQTKLMQQTPATATPDQIRSQKMMMYMMPIMMLVFLYTAPSGLNLYIMVSSFAGAAEQYVIRKHIKEREAAEAASTIVVEAPGKGPRGGRPKKPKGPFWMKRG